MAKARRTHIGERCSWYCKNREKERERKIKSRLNVWFASRFVFFLGLVRVQPIVYIVISRGQRYVCSLLWVFLRRSPIVVYRQLTDKQNANMHLHEQTCCTHNATVYNVNMDTLRADLTSFLSHPMLKNTIVSTTMIHSTVVEVGLSLSTLDTCTFYSSYSFLFVYIFGAVRFHFYSV